MEALSTFGQLLVAGLLTGLVFALVAVGLTLVYGVMDVVNFAHGEFVMLAMYAGFGLALIGIGPLVGLPLVSIALFLFGIVVYRLFVRRLLAGPPEASVFGTFGLLVLMQGLAQALFTSDYRSVPTPPFQGTVQLGVFALPQAALVEGLGAIVLTAALFAFIEYSSVGRAMRAVSEDRTAATLMGIGASFALTAFVVVALGGFGSIAGALLGALIVGVLEVLGGYYLSPELKMVPVYCAYLIVVLARPQGLLGRR